MSSKPKLKKPILGKIQRVSQDVLEEIFSYLQYAQVSEMGRECRSFREAARSILYRALNKIMTRIETEVTKIEEITKSEHKTPIGDTTCYEHIHFAALMTILKMCSSEMRIINACCSRYMRDRELDFCFPAGDLLDDFDSVVKTVRRQTDEPEKRVDGDVTTSLFIKTGRFLDFFDSTLEMVVAKEVPLGVTLLDILGCSQASDFVVELAHAKGRAFHQLKGRYELRDTGTADRPPDFAEYLQPVKAKVLIRYLRNYVRWNNLFDSLHKLWDLEEDTRDLNNNFADKTENTTQFFDDLAKQRTSYTRKNISDTGEICRDIFQQSNSSVESPMGITVEFQLCSRYLPVSLEALKGEHIKAVDSALISDKDIKDACIQTELSYVEVILDADEVYKNGADFMEEVDPDKVLDYVQSVKNSLHNVRNVVDQLTDQATKRPETPGLDSDRYWSSSESLRTVNDPPFYLHRTADSALSFPYQCSTVSINGDYSTMPKMSGVGGQYRGTKPSHMSVVYHCSVQSLPRDTLFTPNFIWRSRNDQCTLSGLYNGSRTKKSNSATRLLSQRKNVSVVKHLVRPATVCGLVENSKLLEKLSERCISLANSIGSHENENVEEDDDTVLEKLLPTAVGQSPKTAREVEDVTVKEVRGQGQTRVGRGSILKRQEITKEFVDVENFLMQMKIYYMDEEQNLRDKIVKVDCSGTDFVIEAS